MRVAGLLVCLLAAAVAVYPESPAQKGAAARTTTLTATASPHPQNPLLTQETVDTWLKNWQRRLGLEEWKIEAQIVRLNQLQKGTIANVHWSLPKRTANVRVLDPIDSTLPKNEVLRDTELSVVHELVHLSMAKLPLDGGDTELEEETVKRISAALMSLNKGENEH